MDLTRVPPQYRRAALQLWEHTLSGGEILADSDLIASVPSPLAVQTSSATVPIRPTEPGIVVGMRGHAFFPTIDATHASMADRAPEKFLGVQIAVASQPKTNGTFEAMFTLIPRRLFWIIETDLIDVTFRNLATAGVGSISGAVSFPFIPYRLLRREA